MGEEPREKKMKLAAEEKEMAAGPVRRVGLSNPRTNFGCPLAFIVSWSWWLSVTLTFGRIMLNLGGCSSRGGLSKPQVLSGLPQGRPWMTASLSDITSPAPPPPHAATPTSAAPPPSSDVIDPLRAISATTSPLSAPPPPPPLPHAASAESEEIKLPSPPDVSDKDEELMKKHFEFEKFWKDSCYYLEPEASNSSYVDIERYSDRFKKSAKAKREEFESTLKLTPRNFLLNCYKMCSMIARNYSWTKNQFNQVLDRVLERLEHYAKIEEESKGKRGRLRERKVRMIRMTVRKRRKEQVEEESEDDYTLKKIPSDDEDDYNMQLD